MSNATTHTPARGGRTPAAELIAGADLPEPIARRIAGIIGATRLWKSERAEIARELIAHAQDALGAGHTPEEAAGALGDPKTIAPLLRRSAKRKRPWHWQIRHRALQAVGISILAVFATYAVLFVRFNIGSPSVTHNYLAELNARNAAFGPDQRALAAYESLHTAWGREHRELMAAEAAADMASGLPPAERPMTALFNFPISRPEMPGYDDLVAAHDRLRLQINAAIEASRRPTLGFLYSDRHERTSVDGVWVTEVLPPSDDPTLGTPLIGVLLPWLGQSRGIAQLIAFDAILADRAARSFAAVLDTARLVGREHTLIASLVALSIQNLAESVLLRTLHEHPDLFSESHLTALAHTAADAGRVSRDLDFATERRFFGDFLQRVYTDDGNGNGRLTAEGIQMFRQIGGVMNDFGLDPLKIKNESITPITGPVAMLAYGTRRDQLDMHDLLIDIAEQSLSIPHSSPIQLELRAKMIEAVIETQRNPRYWMVSLFVPAFHPAIETAHKSDAHTDATLTTLALHIHHQRTGRWPDTLAELTPALLPTIPEDPFDPGQPIKYRLVEGKPNVYFVGADGQDNHAARPVEQATTESVSSLERRFMQGRVSPSPLPADRGDWIIFPPSE